MKEFMNYKDYIGSVHYNDEDEVFHGKLEGIDALVTFEAQSVKELKAAFHEAVDDYIEHCHAMGREPKKTARGCFNVRIGADLHFKALLEASKRGVSLNSLVKKVLDKELSHAR